MEQRALGTTGLSVGCVGLGGMPMSITGRPSTEASVRVIHAALDHGMTLIDTADVYCLDHTDIGHNERLIARALREWSGGSEIVVATKGGLERPDGTHSICVHSKERAPVVSPNRVDRTERAARLISPAKVPSDTFFQWHGDGCTDETDGIA